MATEYKQFKFRRGTAVEWQSNPVLAEGEPGIDLTARRMKVGDGVTAWSGLPWSSMAASEVARLEAAATALAGATAPTDAAMTTIQANPNSAFAQAQKATIAPLRRGVSVQEYGALGNGTADDTTKVQAAINAVSAAGGGEVWFPAGTYIVDGVVLKPMVTLRGEGPRSSILKAKAGGTAVGVVMIASGPVHRANMVGLRITPNGVAGQHGIYAVATAGGGGWWYSTIDSVRVDPGFTGDGIWLRGGIPTDQNPHQFLTFKDIQAFSNAAGRAALRMSGQVGQVQFLGYCEFSGGNATDQQYDGTNILIQRERNDDMTVKSDSAPYNVLLQNVTSQNNRRAVIIDRAKAIALDGMYFENIDQSVTVQQSARGIAVRGCSFNNAAKAYANDGTGFGVKSGGGSYVTVDDAVFEGGVDKHYIGDSASGSLVVSNARLSSASAVTQDMTRQVGIASNAISIENLDTILVNTSASQLTTINSVRAPGGRVTLKALNGPITLATGGNINLGGNPSPLVIPQNSLVTLQRFDLAGTWVVESIGRIRPDTGTAAPSTTPTFIGQEYIDTAAKKVYKAVGNASSADWVLLN